MSFKLFILCLAVLSATVSASSFCKCALDPEKETLQDSGSDSVAKYILKINKNGKDYEEKIDVDPDKETETFHAPKTAPDEEAGDIVYDFKKNLTMIRLPEAKSCFLSDATNDVPKPADLIKLLENKDDVAIAKPQTEVKLKVVGTLEDRSHLCDRMADLCANLPIYVVVEGELESTAVVRPMKKAIAKRAKRDVLSWVCSWVCRPHCKKVCNGWICTTVCTYACAEVCRWVIVNVG